MALYDSSFLFVSLILY